MPTAHNPNGQSDSGFVKHAGGDMQDRITLCRHTALRNEDPFVELDFVRATTITVELNGGQVETFS